jgi:hypothetical protein
MAYSGSPVFQTYKTVKVSFDKTPTYRSGNLSIQRDSNLINCYYDRISQENERREVHIKKRPGLRDTAYPMSKVTPTTDSLRGSFYDAVSNSFFWSVNNKVYATVPPSTTVRTVCTLTTSTGYVGFCDFLAAGTSTRNVIISDGIELWVDNFTTATKVTDVDLPSPHIPQPMSLDGYVFLAKTNTGDVYNCVNDTPLSWQAGDFISTEMSSDYVVKLAQCRSYLVVFGKNSMEMFWDAAVASGSPMKRNDNGYRDVGYISSMCQIGNILYFVGQDQAKNISVYQLDGFKLDRISDEVVDRTLQNITSEDNVKSQAFLDKNGYSLSVDGHNFYCVTSTQATWLYDIDEKMWYEWRASDNTPLAIEGAFNMFNGAQYLALYGKSNFSLMAPDLYQDFGTNFKMSLTTTNDVFETFNWKIAHRVMLDCDMHNYLGVSNVVLKWSDNDWADGGTAGRNINVFGSSPQLHRCGKFRNRSFRLEYSDNYPLRVQGLSLDINVLQH